MLVTGPGRSGTSALTGMLSMLGVHVPGPLVGANSTNERGFYETRWVVDFQRKLLERAYTYEFDGDPRAELRVAKVLADGEAAGKLDAWFAPAAGQHSLVAVKDPRSIWFHDLWTTTAGKHGYQVKYLTTLRHPAEVVGSRTTYYSTETRELQAREYAVAKVAGWVHVSLLNERETREQPRSFVLYDDLISAWRPVAAKIETELGLAFPARPDPWDARHPVDDFISPQLHRVTTTWDDLDCPESLQVIADEVWEACLRIAVHGRDADAEAAFDELSERYSRLYRDSAAIVADMASSRVDRARAKTARKVRAELAAQRPPSTLTRLTEPLPAPVRRRVRRVGRRVIDRLVRR
ncbi:hypothetical protein FHX74_002871 [Friedmanniella endophytica]|uniref:Sulfotransferase family protein n=1 Tax=Microlunatus kandeliicorticis TaxID=1759536 RepID=A0A7W3IU33_9ACTN|nr:hypothetical protein [Microlunatus kandeliicorticis]